MTYDFGEPLATPDQNTVSAEALILKVYRDWQAYVINVKIENQIHFQSDCCGFSGLQFKIENEGYFFRICFLRTDVLI